MPALMEFPTLIGPDLAAIINDRFTIRYLYRLYRSLYNDIPKTLHHRLLKSERRLNSADKPYDFVEKFRYARLQVSF